jgi:alkylation response protein AidB-like acyl-CoA dehydrogenase
MNLEQTDTQAALLDALARLVAQTRAEPLDGRRSLFDAALDAALAASGLLDAAALDELGPVAATLVIDHACRHAAIMEVGASALLRPAICPDWPRPLAVIAGDASRPARFLCEAGSVLFLGERDLRIARLRPGDAAPTPEFFAYPMGRLIDPAACYASAESLGEPSAARRLLRIALACEIAGALQGALDTVAEHVRNRRQFGRALGSFQALQHRLAGDATRIAASRLLARRAADLGGEADAALALGHAQDCAAAIIYDLHQFMGAMGLTLEHPLYRWTYRVRLLLSELGGPSGQFGELAALRWGAA